VGGPGPWWFAFPAAAVLGRYGVDGPCTVQGGRQEGTRRHKTPIQLAQALMTRVSARARAFSGRWRVWRQGGGRLDGVGVSLGQLSWLARRAWIPRTSVESAHGDHRLGHFVRAQWDTHYRVGDCRQLRHGVTVAGLGAPSECPQIAKRKAKRHEFTGTAGSPPWLCLVQESWAAEINLGDLGADGFTCGWGTPKVNQSVAGLPLKIGNETFAKGIAVHAPRKRPFVWMAWRSLSRQGRHSNTDGHNELGSAEFLVYGDDKVLWRSGVMQGAKPPRPRKCRWRGSRGLLLEVTDGGDGSNSGSWRLGQSGDRLCRATPTFLDQKTPCEPAHLYPPQDKLNRLVWRHHIFSSDPVRGDDATRQGGA